MDRARDRVIPRDSGGQVAEGSQSRRTLGTRPTRLLGMTGSGPAWMAGWRIMARRLRTWLVALALAAPLVAITAWVIHGATRPAARGRRRSAGPAGRLARPAPAPRRPARRAARGARGRRGRRAPRRAAAGGSSHWRFERPPADAEALFFGTAEGARAVLEREAGPERTPGPGDEAQVSAQAVYFRRGAGARARLPRPRGLAAARRAARAAPGRSTAPCRRGGA